jgi:Putative bacterial sensory transduction regulator
MSNELVTPETVTLEAVRDLYEAALLDVSLDEESGFVVIDDEIVARAKLSDTKERLQLIAFYKVREDAERIDRLELVNRINDQYVLIRAAVGEEDELWIDYGIVLKGGATKKQIAHATRMFLKVAEMAVKDCDEDGIVT